MKEEVQIGGKLPRKLAAPIERRGSPRLDRLRSRVLAGGKRVTRVNSTNVLDEGLRIGEIGRRMNSKVKSVKQGVYRK
jgi:hypothetical protein